MTFTLTEPTHARYIFVNPKTNIVHVLMPIVGGQTIGTDNTCKSVHALQEFFGLTRNAEQKTILRELIHYKEALKFDLSLITDNPDLTEKKQERLKQIEQYIKAIEFILKSPILSQLKKDYPEYPLPLKSIMNQDESNLYSMVLRPKEMDNFLRFINPTFSVQRKSKQVFYSTLSATFKDIALLPTARERLIDSVWQSVEGQNNDFEGIQRVLKEQTQKQFGVVVDFKKGKKNETVSKDYIETVIMSNEPLTAKEYINTLIDCCAGNLFEMIEESPFYSRKSVEELSIITQFFLGSINIFCKANEISKENFGAILDNNQTLSEAISALVLSVDVNDNIENALLDFINQNQQTFGLKKALTSIDCRQIKTQFTQNYKTIKESPHFDEFALLDDTKTGLFFSHQGSICLNMAEFIRVGFPEFTPQHVNAVCTDFKTLKYDIPPNNPNVHATIELSFEELLTKVKNEAQLEFLLQKLPEEQKRLALTSFTIKKQFLDCVAKGQQDEAERLLEDNPDASLLLNPVTFTDYSDRTFSCTAYEYAYWAKDKHMCRMLEKHMDVETAGKMLERIDAMERIDTATSQPMGLRYYQHDSEHHTVHFDLTPLQTALNDYVNGFDGWCNAKNWTAMNAAWMKVGIAQRDLPIHVINEYCREDRTFMLLPSFDEDNLPRTLTYYDNKKLSNLFPLVISNTSGLGVDFALIRAGEPLWAFGCGGMWSGGHPGEVDLLAVTHLDKVRTEDLAQSRENLKLMATRPNLVVP